MADHPMHIDVDKFISKIEDGMANDKEWQAKTKGILKAEIARRHLTYAQVVEKLAALGIKDTDVNIRNKISRGGFSAAFFVQVLVAIGAHTVRFHEVE